MIVAGGSTVAVLSSQATAAMAGGRRFRPVGSRVRACSRLVRIRAGQPFEHDSNVCPGGFLGFLGARNSLSCGLAAARVQNGLPAAERGMLTDHTKDFLRDRVPAT